MRADLVTLEEKLVILNSFIKPDLSGMQSTIMTDMFICLQICLPDSLISWLIKKFAVPSPSRSIGIIFRTSHFTFCVMKDAHIPEKRQFSLYLLKYF